MENNQKFEQIIKIIGLIVLALVLTPIVLRLLLTIIRLIVFVVVLAGIYYKKEKTEEED